MSQCGSYHAAMASDFEDNGVEHDADERVHKTRLWVDNGWTTRVIKNEDDDS